MRLTANLASLSAGLRVVGRLDPRKTCLLHSRRQFRHHAQPFRAFHAMPARDLGERAPATEAKVGSRIHHADCDTRRFYAHRLIVKRIRSLAKRIPYNPVPALRIGLWRLPRSVSAAFVVV